MVAWQGHQGPKRPHTVQEGRKKILKTVEWYNKNGNLASEIDVKDVRPTLFAIEPHKALQILKGLEDKADSIKNPTLWIKKAAERDVPALPTKVGKTLNWYNKQGKLQKEIEFDAVRPLLASLPMPVALTVLAGLDGKEETINDPTAWLIRAAESYIEQLGDEVLQAQAAGWSPSGASAWSGSSGPPAGGSSSWSSGGAEVRLPAKGKGKGKGGAAKGDGASAAPSESTSIDAKIAKAITWYNHNGGLQQKIDIKEVAPFLSQLPVEKAVGIVQGLDGKGPTIRDPTWWLISAAKRHGA